MTVGSGPRLPIAQEPPADAPPPATDETPSAVAASRPRSRRSIIAAALGGVAGLAAARLGRPSAARAAAGDPLILGEANDSGTAQTTLENAGLGAAFTLKTTNTSGGATGIFGWSSNAGAGATRGVYGRVDGPNSNGVFGRNLGAAGTGAAVFAEGNANDGVVASTTNNGRYAVEATGANGTAIYASAIQIGVEGSAYRGVKGTASASGASAGVWGQGGTGADNYGVLGEVTNATGRGVFGINHANSATSFGVYGETDATTGGAAGVRGVDSGGTGITNGVHGSTSSTLGNGVFGTATANNTSAFGVYGVGTGASRGVVGESGTGQALQGFGNGSISGNWAVGGTLTKGAGAFKIDHPLDPANKYLMHSFVESPDMKNVYDGVVKLGTNGSATIKLPAWFGKLNRDFRYQLTAVGKAAPDLHVSRRVERNQFSIAGGNAGQEISWQVTGIRQDTYANKNRIPVELAKNGAEKGTYLHAEALGQPNAKSVHARELKALKRSAA